MNHLSTKEALNRLSQSDAPFLEVFKHGSLMVEMYKPDKVDYQQPHSRDEVYIIASGKGIFRYNEEEKEVRSGDFLFVKAGDVHKFLNFDDDFATWVLFYGPEGGENKNIL